MVNIEKDLKLYRKFIDKYCLGSPDHSYLIRMTLLPARTGEENVKSEFIKETWEDFLKSDFPESEIKFYNHIPFCFRRCHFCCYSSNTVQSSSVIDSYVKKMVDHYRFFEPTFKEYDFSSLCIGGGTPSALNSSQMTELLSGLFSSFNFEKDGQRCIEFNPSSSSYEKLKIAKNFDFNKISFGVQSLDDNLLKINNRGYQTIEEVDRAISDAKKIGFETVSVDLLSGLWGDSGNELLNSFKKTVSLAPDSIYIYSVQPTENYLKDICCIQENDFAEQKKKIMDSVSGKIFRVAQEGNYNTHGFMGRIANMRERDVIRFTKRGYDAERHIASKKKENSSTFGLGTYSYSYIYKRIFYTMNEEPNSDPRKSYFCANTYNEDGDMINFILAGLSSSGSLSLTGFRNIFKRDFFDVFKEEMLNLEKINAFKIDGKTLRFSLDGYGGWVLPFLFFIDKKIIEKIINEPIQKMRLMSDKKNDR